MLDAIIFDCDGVLVDSEPIHLDCFRSVLAARGIELHTADYYDKYLGFDDHDCFVAVLANNDRPVAEDEVTAMIAEKTELVKKTFAAGVPAMAGALELMRSARAAGMAVGICSGGLREEIELATAGIGALPLVDVVISATDVPRGKPDPAGYLLAMKLLAEKLRRRVRPERSWVVEDAPAGIQAAKSAGCHVLAVTNSYDRPALAGADRIVDSLAEVRLGQFD